MRLGKDFIQSGFIINQSMKFFKRELPKPCLVCNGRGEVRDKKTGKLRPCVACPKPKAG